MPLYDISLPLHTRTAVWPGDTPFQFNLSWRMDAGASVNVGAVTMSVHTGTHADAPFHFAPDGEGAGEMDLAPFFGLAVVVDVSGIEVIGWHLLQHLDFAAAPRLLLRTNAWADPTVFPERIPTLAPDVPERLRECGILLVGLDLPSVDAIDSTILPLHHALHKAGIRILESLVLRDIIPGIYALSALPLKLIGADGAPVRAILAR